METHTGEQSDPTSSGRVTSSPDDGEHGAQANGTAANEHVRGQAPTSGPYIGRRVTPSTFKLDEMPEERAERKRHLRAVLESLRAATHEPATEEERLDALIREEMMARLDRDYTMSVVPMDFLLYEPAALREERIRRTREGLAALREGDPEEHRETLAVLLAALDGEDASSGEARSSE